MCMQKNYASYLWYKPGGSMLVCICNAVLPARLWHTGVGRRRLPWASRRARDPWHTRTFARLTTSVPPIRSVPVVDRLLTRRFNGSLCSSSSTYKKVCYAVVQVHKSMHTTMRIR